MSMRYSTSLLGLCVALAATALLFVQGVSRHGLLEAQPILRKDVIEHLQDGRSMTELCQEYGVSRKTGYKWIQRFREEGAEGLSNALRAPRIHPNATPTKLIGRLVQLRKQLFHLG